ncbi:MAG TPA: DUF885 domain-containing protein [Candidatus Scybalocola faecigallinarum]|uniref:DUF885 domain-containing protein n=1 Tax=Candidatus Scybalocola faecigallinarum TaxID=2840941 RepID=A0A9D1F6V4_9FIRM|nr:DUF885 domain-containing protein [Candidatus Scybalocola faecigallinarum]
MLRKSYGSLSLGLAGILSVSTILSGCAQNPGIRNTSRTSAAAADTQIGLLPGDSPEFNNFLMDLFNEQITSNSIDFHYSLEHPENYGLSMENVTFGTVDISNPDQDLEDTKAVLDQLRDFDYDTLSSRQQLIYDMLEENFQDSIDSIDYTLYQTIFSPTIGIQAQLPVILSEYTFRTQQDIDDYILLLEDVDRYFSELLDVEKAKAEAGFFMADFTADAVISQCQEFIASPQENLLIDIFQEKLDSEMPELSQEQKDDYIRRNQDAVLNHVIPAYENLIEGLTALKGTGTNEGGLANYENGADYYSMLAKSATGSSKTVDEMIQLTDDALSDDLNTILTLYFSDTDLLTEMTEAQPPSTDPREILDMLQTAITDEFPQPVSGEFTIKYVHKSLEENLSPAFYMVPAIDAVDSNTIYINNYYTNAENAMSLFTTLAHEGYPGHLYESTWFNSTNPHPIRKLLNYSGYSEGWATYVEMRSFAWTGVSDSIAQALSANQDFSLGLCARVDMGVNYQGWTREETTEYMNQFGMGDEDTVTWLYEAVVAEPSNYLSYYIGYKEFKALRAEAEEALGTDFDPVSFHEFILTTGPAPFDLIREQMDVWISQVNDGNAQAA